MENIKKGLVRKILPYVLGTGIIASGISFPKIVDSIIVYYSLKNISVPSEDPFEKMKEDLLKTPGIPKEHQIPDYMKPEHFYLNSTKYTDI
jgi:hypothetical protein